MNFETMANTIRSRFSAQIATPESVPTQYDNHNMEPPDDQLWVRLTIVPGDSSQVSIGGDSNNRYRNVGVMIAQIFLPIGHGDQEAYQLADKIKTAFNSKSDSGVVFKTTSIARVGKTNSWWQLNVKCPFYADDIS